MFICFLWQDTLGEGMRLVSLKFLFCCCILEEEASNVSLGFQWWLPPPPLKRQEARHGQLVPWTDTGAEAVGGGEPRIITGFWSIRPCLTQALVKKTALYGKLMGSWKSDRAIVVLGKPSLFWKEASFQVRGLLMNWLESSPFRAGTD